MKRTKIILFGVIFLSALTFASCGSRKVKECKEGDRKECCEKKKECCEKKSGCCEKKDSTKCEKKCEHSKDTTKTK
ncbi:MAG: hypothetical protein HXX16_14260 [Bacteroidales bacterium]|nr:hypothetical protein [Bacteroidales bacterium]